MKVKAANKSPRSVPARTSRATCCLVAMVEYAIPKLQSRLRRRRRLPAWIVRRSCWKPAAVNTAKATCKEGQALPEPSTDFRKAIEGY